MYPHSRVVDGGALELPRTGVAPPATRAIRSEISRMRTRLRGLAIASVAASVVACATSREPTPPASTSRPSSRPASRPATQPATQPAHSRAARPAPTDPEALPDGVEQIIPRGRIAAIDDPVFVPADEATIADDAWVLGVDVGGEPRAYSLLLLNHHEVVNDQVGGKKFAAVW